MKNILRHLETVLHFTSKKSKFALSGLLALAFISTAAVFAGWTPDRPVYDWNNSAERVGSTNGPRMNAFINTPDYGDERAFFDSRKQEETTGRPYKDVLPYVTQGSKRIVMRTYVHNGANQSTNDDPAPNNGVAKDAKVRIDLPTGTATALRSRSYISISNPAPGYPGEVTDTTEFVDTAAFAIRYVPGSAKIYNAAHSGGLALSDNIVTSGATIGHDQLNGNVPGCFEFQATVEITVEVIVAQPSIEKVVRKAGDSTYTDFAQVKPGDNIQWRIFFQNKGSMALDKVAITDQLPPHLRLVPGSVRWIYVAANGSNQDVVQPDNDLFTKYVDFGSWGPNGGFYLRFDTTALDDFSNCEATVRNQTHMHSTQTPKDITDTADVRITKQNCAPPPPPQQSFACEGLDMTKVNRTTFNFTGRGKVVNTTITGYIFKVNGAVKQDSASPNFTLTETTPGTYTVTVQVKTPIGTTEVTPQCTKQAVVEQEAVTPKYSCDQLQAELISGRKYKFTTATTAEGGATVRRYFYTFGDNTPELTTDKNVVEHEYAKAGTYTAKVKVEFMVNGQLQTAEGPNCTKIITIGEQPPVTQAPTKLPDTGFGLIGTFITTTILGALGFQVVTLRKLL